MTSSHALAPHPCRDLNRAAFRTDRQTDRQRDRQKDRQTSIHPCIQTGSRTKEIDKQTNRCTFQCLICTSELTCIPMQYKQDPSQLLYVTANHQQHATTWSSNTHYLRLFRTENNVKADSLFWKQSTKSIIRLNINTLQTIPSFSTLNNIKYKLALGS